jgi:hypothetical protein
MIRYAASQEFSSCDIHFRRNILNREELHEKRWFRFVAVKEVEVRMSLVEPMFLLDPSMERPGMNAQRLLGLSHSPVQECKPVGSGNTLRLSLHDA